MGPGVLKILETLKRQFLCSSAIDEEIWEEIANLSWDDQTLLLDHTILHELNKSLPIKEEYQLRFLKRLVQALEHKNNEVHDSIYNALCSLQITSNNDQAFIFKHYLLPHQKTTFSLRESKSFVLDGTTGLCSWPASLYLSQWLLCNTPTLTGKRILELGSGTGLTSFIASRCCKASEVLLTDGSPKVVDLLNENIERNFDAKRENVDIEGLYLYKEEDRKIGTLCLAWENVDYQIEKIMKPDVILAADVIYDKSVLPALTGAIDAIFKITDNKCKLILANTLRNEETFKEFCNLLEQLKFTTEMEEECFLENYLFWDKSTPIHLYQISR